MAAITTASGALEALRAQVGHCALMLLRWMALSETVRSDPVVADFIGGHCERVDARVVANPANPPRDRMRTGNYVAVSPDAIIPTGWHFEGDDTTHDALDRPFSSGLWVFNIPGQASEHEHRALEQRLAWRYGWETSSVTKAVKAVLKAHTRGIKWSVTKGSGTASSWIDIRGSLVIRRGGTSTRFLSDAVAVARQRLGITLSRHVRRRPVVGGTLEDNTVEWTGKSEQLRLLNQSDITLADRAVGVDSPLGRMLALEGASGQDVVLLSGDEAVVLFVTGGLRSFARPEALRRWGLSEGRVDAAQKSLIAKGLMTAKRAISKAGRSEVKALGEMLGLGQWANHNPPWTIEDGKVKPLGGGELSSREKTQQRLIDAATTPTFPAQFAKAHGRPEVGATALTLTWHEDDGLFIEGDTKVHKTLIKAWVPRVGRRSIGGKWVWGGRRRPRWLRSNTLGPRLREVITDSVLEGWAEALATATGAVVTARRQSAQVAIVSPTTEDVARRALAEEKAAEAQAFRQRLHVETPWPLSDTPPSAESLKKRPEGFERWHGWRALFVAGFDAQGRSQGIPQPVLIERIDHGGRTFVFSTPGRTGVRRGHVEGIVALWPPFKGQSATDPKKLLQVLHLRIQVSSIRREAVTGSVSATVRGVLTDLKGRLDALEKEAREPINDQRDLLESPQVAARGAPLGALPFGRQGWVMGVFFYPLQFERGRRPNRRTMTEWFLPIQRLKNGNLKGLHIERTQGGRSWRGAVMLSWEPHFIDRVSPGELAMSVHPREVPVPVWLATRQWQPAKRR